MADEKTRWSRPRLIVLGRGKPEESILLACKTPQDGACAAGTGPGRRPGLTPGKS